MLTDRSQGGSSIKDGEIELMVSCGKIIDIEGKGDDDDDDDDDDRPMTDD